MVLGGDCCLLVTVEQAGWCLSAGSGGQGRGCKVRSGQHRLEWGWRMSTKGQCLFCRQAAHYQPSSKSALRLQCKVVPWRPSVAFPLNARLTIHFYSRAIMQQAVRSVDWQCTRHTDW